MNAGGNLGDTCAPWVGPPRVWPRRLVGRQPRELPDCVMKPACAFPDAHREGYKPGLVPRPVSCGFGEPAPAPACQT